MDTYKIGPNTFDAARGWVNENEMPSKYIGFVDMAEINAVGQFFQIDTKATFCFHLPKSTWQCRVALRSESL